MAGLKTKPEYKGMAEAVSLGIAVLKKSKQNTWPGLVAAIAETDPLVVKAFKALDLTDAQLEVINDWQPVLNLVQIAPPIIPAVCPACNHYILTADTAPSRCMVLAGCEGRPFKVIAATGNTAQKAAAAKEPAGEAKATAPKRSTTAVKAEAAAAVEVLEAVTESVVEYAEAKPDAGSPAPAPVEAAPAAAEAPVPESEPFLDMVIVADDEDPFA